MLLEFTKMHGLGNDFVVIDAINQSVTLDAETVRTLSDRHRGIGCDQVLLIETAHNTDSDFFYRIFNADGSEVAQCGNGARCFARFVHDKGMFTDKQIRVETMAGLMQLQIEADGQVTVDMGIPKFEPNDIPLRRDHREAEYEINFGDNTIRFGALSIGNPHAVMLVSDIDSVDVTNIGRLLESHPDFPQRVNVGFLQLIDKRHLRLRVYERGAGETEACGSGACAAMIFARQQGVVNDKVTVELRGGTLLINWTGENSPVRMTGPACHVFDGRIDI